LTVKARLLPAPAKKSRAEAVSGTANRPTLFRDAGGRWGDGFGPMQIVVGLMRSIAGIAFGTCDLVLIAVPFH